MNKAMAAHCFSAGHNLVQYDLMGCNGCFQLIG
jgi:hypothetical protein